YGRRKLCWVRTILPREEEKRRTLSLPLVLRISGRSFLPGCYFFTTARPPFAPRPVYPAILPPPAPSVCPAPRRSAPPPSPSPDGGGGSGGGVGFGVWPFSRRDSAG